MSSFSQTQRRGCSEILNSLGCDNLRGLKETIVGERLTTDDLISIILNHSQSAEELLKRRKVLREDIFKYLNKQGFDLSPSLDKQQLIDYALTYWSISEMNREPSTAEADLQLLHQIQKEELEKARRQDQQLQRQEQMWKPPQGATAMDSDININISQTQRRGCLEILKSLGCENLCGLKETILHGGLTTVDLISIILNHSQSAEKLLKRRKVLREDILKYLNKQGFDLSPSLDKQQLIDYALTYWSISETNKQPSTAEADLQLLHQIQKEELEKAKRQDQQLQRQEQMRKPPQGATAMDSDININISQYRKW